MFEVLCLDFNLKTSGVCGHSFDSWEELGLVGMASRRHLRYSSLPADDDYDGKFDPRFDYTPKSFDNIPWKSIALALFLLFLGILLLCLSIFIFTGHMGGDKSQAYGLLALGLLTFLPGMEEHSFLFSCPFILNSLGSQCLIVYIMNAKWGLLVIIYAIYKACDIWGIS